MLTLPNTLPVKQLQMHGPAYDCEQIELYTALYTGGRLFQDNIRHFLTKRPLECASDGESGIGGHKHYETRMKSAFYINRAGGLIDWFTARVYEDTPTIQVGEGVSDDSRAYWEGLNDNADGLGTPLAGVMREALRDVFLHKRGYFLSASPIEVVSGTDPANMTISHLRSPQVDDWQESDRGILEWARAISKKLDRGKNGIAPAEQETWYWRYFAEGMTVTYAATKPVNREFARDAVATAVDAQEHGFGLPVFEVRADRSSWVMDRIFPVVKGLYNRESALNFALDMGAFQMLLLNLDTTDINKIVATQLAALKLKPQESATFLSPDAAIFRPLFDDVERWKGALYETVNAIAKEMATVPQAGRLSGDAVEKMSSPLKTLMESFAWPVDDAMNRTIQAIKDFRGESDAEVSLVRGNKPATEGELVSDVKTMILEDPEPQTEMEEEEE